LAHFLARIQIIEHAREFRIEGFHFSDEIKIYPWSFENVALRLNMRIFARVRCSSGKNHEVGK
jgi:hypothetical protein